MQREIIASNLVTYGHMCWLIYVLTKLFTLYMYMYVCIYVYILPLKCGKLFYVKSSYFTKGRTDEFKF